MANEQVTPDCYETRQSGRVLCNGHALNLGYSPACLRDMARHGIHLYKNGKRVKLCEVT
ncbi:MAG: hypothetical protein ACI3VA_02125 [Candidatus Limivicinus sp.]